MADRRRSHGRHRLIAYIRGDDDSVAWAPIVFGLALVLGLGLLVLGSVWNAQPDRRHSEVMRPAPGPMPAQLPSRGQ
jgi:hypothetical protein